jgi:hypothetical protein
VCNSESMKNVSAGNCICASKINKTKGDQIIPQESRKCRPSSILLFEVNANKLRSAPFP